MPYSILKNGINLGIAFRNLNETIYPCVGLRSQSGSIERNFGSGKFKLAETTSNDIGETYHLTKEAIIDLAKLLGIEPNLKNFLEIKQDTALKFQIKFNFIMKRYENAIVDLTKLINIEPNNKFVLRYRGEAYHLTERYKDSVIDLTKLFGNESSNGVDKLLKK
ncbi:hypothetical protein C2G38_2202784 [Gigaspora rosea]|uniref:Uncharacterized protein n=1 Tax=Gigaspora rosea TaxID=44941 RepID=A0A397UQS3_9GLOM|nr:hypothetical protein C2G38_2202784 [Gigaspora rosea]